MKRLASGGEWEIGQSSSGRQYCLCPLLQAQATQQPYREDYKLQSDAGSGSCMPNRLDMLDAILCFMLSLKGKYTGIKKRGWCVGPPLLSLLSILEEKYCFRNEPWWKNGFGTFLSRRRSTWVQHPQYRTILCASLYPRCSLMNLQMLWKDMLVWQFVKRKLFQPSTQGHEVRVVGATGQTQNLLEDREDPDFRQPEMLTGPC